MSVRQGSIESLFLKGEAGRLEALLNVGVADAPYTCVVCHPHPLYGGNMHDKVVFHAMKALNALGFPVLRFNFRGVGSSAGEHDHGQGEIADTRVALDYLAERFSAPILFVGYSFGTAVGLRAAVIHPRVEALISLGTPVNVGGCEYDYGMLEESRKPKLLLSGDHDQFATPAQLAQLFAKAHEPKRLVMIPGANHTFSRRLEEMGNALSDWARELGPVNTT